MSVEYDYIVTGGGAAGRSLISRLLQSPLRDKRILLIDRESKTENDRTWCFWEKQAGFFESIVYHSWDQLWVHTDDRSQLLSIQPYTYKLIRGIDFYQYTDRLIGKAPQVDVVYGEVQGLRSTETGATVSVNGRTYTCDWCFNSIFFGSIDKERVHYLDQHFRGWFLRTKEPVFDPGQATLMDFRTDQQGEVRFLYVLPNSAKEALVEVAIFSNRHLTADGYDQILKDYIRQHLPDLHDFEIVQTEMGNIPMTDHDFATSDGHIIHLGMAGGDTRASSGYTFYNIQQRLDKLVQALVKNGSPLLPEPWPVRRSRFYDKLMLSVLENGYYAGDDLFGKLFARNEASTVLAFLNAETSLLRELQVAASLPHWPFWKALVRELMPGVKPALAGN